MSWLRACYTGVGFIGLSLAPATVLGQEEDPSPRLILELEGGPVWQSRNDVQIPNDETGTRFALDDLTGSGPFPSFRLYAEGRLGRKHGLRLLVAPLSIEGTGVLSSPVDFNGFRFESGKVTEASYRFDSYRLTYRYQLVEKPKWSLNIGLSAKLRAAEIKVVQEGVSTSYSNTGFVPLLYAAAAWRPSPRWALALDVEGAAASQGRAFDASLKLYRRVSDRWSVSLGYRTLEGGADVEDVYTFAWFHYAMVSVVFRPW
jgi:hypothetical protein